jgi:hypothetical protein
MRCEYKWFPVPFLVIPGIIILVSLASAEIGSAIFYLLYVLPLELAIRSAEIKTEGLFTILLLLLENSVYALILSFVICKIKSRSKSELGI